VTGVYPEYSTIIAITSPSVTNCAYYQKLINTQYKTVIYRILVGAGRSLKMFSLSILSIKERT
jgi:hypothetical protein